MNWITIITTIFDIAWLLAVLVLLWFIWRDSAKHTRKVEEVILRLALDKAKEKESKPE